MAEHAGASAESRCWTDLPVPCWRLIMTHLHSKRSLFSCSAACNSFARVADDLATDLRGVPAGDLTRALARFDRVTSVAVDLAAAPRPTHQKREGGALGQDGGPEEPGDFQGWCAAAAVLASELRAVPPLAAARIERLSVSNCPSYVADTLAYSFEPGAPAWRRLARLELSYDVTASGPAPTRRYEYDWAAVIRAAGALPALRSMRLAGAICPLWGFTDSLWLGGLQDLEIVGPPVEISPYDVPAIPGLPDLLRLSVARVRGRTLELEHLKEHLTSLQELCISDAPDLRDVIELSLLAALTSLRVHACPDATRNAVLLLATALVALTQLRALELTGTTTLEKLPAAIPFLNALTSLVVDVRMRDSGPDGPEPKDFAPLGDGTGLLGCFGLRRLVVRGFNAPLHMPEGMERFSLLEELDLGGCQEVRNLGPWLLRLPALKRLVVPRRSVQQGVFEALALRNDPHQVEVVEEGGGDNGEGQEGYERFSWRNCTMS